MKPAPQSTRAAQPPDPVTLGLFFFGVSSLGLGLLMAFASGPFFELLGPYGTRNDHYIHDMASFQIALAVPLLVALKRPSWRAPALAANAIQWSLHSVSHLIDIGDADPAWIGYFAFAATAAGAVLLTLLALRAAREESLETAP